MACELCTYVCLVWKKSGRQKVAKAGGNGTAMAVPVVTGYFAPQEIWHPHAVFPRKMGTPSGNLAPPIVVVF